MEAALQRRVQRYGWDKASGYYERSWRSQLAPAQELLLARAALQPGERVLDVACGTGLVTFPAAEAVGADGRVTGVDISRQMVELAAAEATRRGLGHVEFVRSDAESMDVESGVYDIALCALGLMYFPDPVEALRRMGDALRPGGRVVAAVWGARRNCGWAGIFPVVDARVDTDVCPLFFRLGTGETLQYEMEQAGLVDVETVRIEVVLSYASEAEALEAAFAGGPVALAYDRFDEPTRADAHREYLETIREFRDGDGYRIPGEFVVGIARRS
jgi:ubiquinone/menaquinone biosynthesis C-methylase UbiE